ncbi:MAG: hypothetical protein ACJAUP_000830 [Cellvibrionaceae bacterium]|jgi:hypothetical protein
MSRTRKKHYPVADIDEPDENVLLKKQLTAVKAIRKRRLNRHEAEYRQKLKELELSREALEAHDGELHEAKEALTDGKELLRSQYLNTVSTLGHLREWSDKEDALKKNVALASRVRQKTLERIDADKEAVEEAKKNYQKTLLSIEKIDIILEEVE